MRGLGSGISDVSFDIEEILSHIPYRISHFPWLEGGGGKKQWTTSEIKM